MLRNVHLWLSCVVMLCCAVSCSAQRESADGPPSLTSSKSSSEAQQRPGAQAPAHEASKASSSKDEVGAEPSVERSPPARRDALEDSLEEVAAEREPLEDSAEEAAAEPESEAEPKRKKEAPIPALAPAPAPAPAPSAPHSLSDADEAPPPAPKASRSASRSARRSRPAAKKKATARRGRAANPMRLGGVRVPTLYQERFKQGYLPEAPQGASPQDATNLSSMELLAHPLQVKPLAGSALLGREEGCLLEERTGELLTLSLAYLMDDWGLQVRLQDFTERDVERLKAPLKPALDQLNKALTFSLRGEGGVWVCHQSGEVYVEGEVSVTHPDFGLLFEGREALQEQLKRPSQAKVKGVIKTLISGWRDRLASPLVSCLSRVGRQVAKGGAPSRAHAKSTSGELLRGAEARGAQCAL